MSSNVFWSFAVNISVEHLSSIRFHSFRMKLMADWWGNKKTAFCDFERAFAILGYVTLKSMSDSQRPLGVVSGFSVFSLKCRLHGGIGLPFLH